jgi:hypothetical protein
MKPPVAEKPLSDSILRRFGAFRERHACHRESGFVNHVGIVSNRSVPEAFFEFFAAVAALS